AAHVNLDLHRIDGIAGSVILAATLTGDRPDLDLRLDAAEPSGMLANRLLGRTDRLPLALSMNGRGPLADWQGRAAAGAGASPHFGGKAALAGGGGAGRVLPGPAAVAPLVPADFAPLVGDRVALALRAKFKNGVVVDPLSVEAAAGRVT